MTKKIIATIVIVVIGVAIVLGFKSAIQPSVDYTKVSDQTEKNLGDQIQNEPFWFTNGARFGRIGVGYNWASVSMGRGMNQASWQNTTGQTVYVLSALARAQYSTGTASSSFALYAGTSTTATITNSANPIYGSIWDNVVIATGTPANVAFDFMANSAFAGTREQGVIAVPNLQYVVFALEAPYSQACDGSKCEQATSSNRGFTTLGISFPYITN